MGRSKLQSMGAAGRAWLPAVMAAGRVAVCGCAAASAQTAPPGQHDDVNRGQLWRDAADGTPPIALPGALAP